MNLISNSVKHTNNGKIHILLDNLDDCTIIVRVIDNGTGIITEKYNLFYKVKKLKAGSNLLVFKILKLLKVLVWV